MKVSLRNIKRASSPKRLNLHLRRLERVTVGHAHTFIISRLENLRIVSTNAAAWLLFIGLLIVAVLWQGWGASRLYSLQGPSKGGTYTEGVIGAVDNINPIFASTPAEKSISRLLFANLMTFDDTNHMTGELAQSVVPDSTGKVYTMTLRHGMYWQDNVPITATDVVFTVNLIKDADTRSPLYGSWRNIGVEEVDPYTVRFTLPGPYAAFESYLQLGILPEHVLSGITPASLRNDAYNQTPGIVDGPFTFQAVHQANDSPDQVVVSLRANPNYFLGAPQLDRFQIHAYATSQELVRAFQVQEISAIADTSVTPYAQIKGSTVTRTEAPLYNAVYAFLKTDSPMLQDVRVRQALELATDQQNLITALGNNVQPAYGPLVDGQLGYPSDLRQQPFDLTKAGQLLDAAGWKRGSDGVRVKNGQQLKLSLVSVDSGDYPIVVQTIMKQWSKLGVAFSWQLVRPQDAQQNVLSPRSYDVLLYEIALGNDPDVYPYWHSSQATQLGLNLSDYHSAKADEALDGGRSRLDPALRVAKYRAFVEQWLADTPAIALYRPSLTYLQLTNNTSFPNHPLTDITDRYYNIRYWSAGMTTVRPIL